MAFVLRQNWEFCCFSFKTATAALGQGGCGIQTCDLHETGAMLYQPSYKAAHWERDQLVESISFYSSREDTDSLIDLAPNVWLHDLISWYSIVPVSQRSLVRIPLKLSLIFSGFFFPIA